MKKTKMGIFKVYYFASGTYLLAFKVYLEYVYCIFSYVYITKKTCHPYIGSTTVLPDTLGAKLVYLVVV